MRCKQKNHVSQGFSVNVPSSSSPPDSARNTELPRTIYLRPTSDSGVELAKTESPENFEEQSHQTRAGFYDGEINCL